MTGTCAELEHPADLFVQINAAGLDELFENALYAFYSHVADLGRLGNVVAGHSRIDLELASPSLEEALRALLAEALYVFDAEGFVAATARVTVRQEETAETLGSTGCAERSEEPPSSLGVLVQATLWGDKVVTASGALLTEVKAVTYHRLAVSRRPDGGWRATVLFDI
jgi:SHS2 domain-containing protein